VLANGDAASTHPRDRFASHRPASTARFTQSVSSFLFVSNPHSMPQIELPLADQELIDAAFHGDMDALRRLLPTANARAQAHARDANGQPRGEIGDALMHASSQGHANAVELLLPASRPTATNPERRTALMFAAARGHAECARLLLPVSEPNRGDSFGETAFLKAASNASAGWDCMNLLAEVSDPNETDWAGETAFLKAASNASAGWDCMNLLAEVSDPNETDWAGETALMRAAEVGDAKTVAFLAPLSDVSLVDTEGKTALMHAASCGSASCVKILLPGSDLLAVDSENKDAMSHAVDAQALVLVTNCLRLFLDAMKPDERAEGCRRAIERGIAIKLWEVVDFLFEHAAPVLVEQSFRMSGPEFMPRWAAHQEAIELQSVVFEPDHGSGESQARLEKNGEISDAPDALGAEGGRLKKARSL